MAYAWIIPIAVVAILGLSGYLVYRYVIFDILANNTVNNTLKRYNIKKTQFEIVKEFNENKGEKLSDSEINRLAKHYRRNEPINSYQCMTIFEMTNIHKLTLKS